MRARRDPWNHPRPAPPGRWRLAMERRVGWQMRMHLPRRNQSHRPMPPANWQCSLWHRSYRAEFRRAFDPHYAVHRHWQRPAALRGIAERAVKTVFVREMPLMVKPDQALMTAKTAKTATVVKALPGKTGEYWECLRTPGWRAVRCSTASRAQTYFVFPLCIRPAPASPGRGCRAHRLWSCEKVPVVMAVSL